MTKTKIVTAILLLIVVSAAIAQDYQRRRGYNRFRRNADPRNGVPIWKNDKAFEEDVFTFVRIRYRTVGRRYGW